ERPCPGAFNAAKPGGMGTDHFTGRHRRWSHRDSATAGDLAQDGWSLAPPLAERGCTVRRGGALKRRTALWRARDIHARTDLPDRGSFLSGPGNARCSDQPLESE